MNLPEKNILIGLVTLAAFANCIRLFWNESVNILLGSYDSGWIIQTGQYILRSGIPSHDLFSWTYPDRIFVAYQWLFEVMVASLFNLGGLWLIGLSVCITSGILYLYLLPRFWISRGIPPAVPYLALSLVLTPHWVNVRPQLCSYFLLLFFIHVLEIYRTSRREAVLWLLPPTMLLWLNLHLFWSIGLLLLAFYCLCDLWKNRAEVPKISKKQLFKMSLPKALLLCLILLSFNPYGMRLIAYLFTFLDGSQFLGMNEVKPSVTLKDAVFVLTYLALAWLILLERRKSLPAEAWIVTSVSTIAALAVRRYESIAVLLTWPYVAMALEQVNWSKSFLMPLGKPVYFFQGLQRSKLYLLVTAVVVSSAVWYFRSPTEDSARTIFLRGTGPVLQFAGKYLMPPDRLFNDPATGDWLIFCKTAPVFVDTRFDMYPRLFCQDTGACLYAGVKGSPEYIKNYGGPGNLAYIKSYGATHILVLDTFGPIGQSLISSPDWLLICDDGVLSFWCRNLAAEQLRMEQLKISDDLIHSAQLPPCVVDLTIRRRCLKYFTMAKNCSPKQSVQAIQLLQRALLLMPNSKTLHNELERWHNLKGDD